MRTMLVALLLCSCQEYSIFKGNGELLPPDSSTETTVDTDTGQEGETAEVVETGETSETGIPVDGLLLSEPTTKGTEFWLGFMENLNLSGNGPPEFGVQVAAEEATTGEISIPATGLTIPFEVGAGEAVEIELPSAIYYPEGSETVQDVGIRITTDKPVDVRAMHYRLYFSDGTIVLPMNELADHYVVLAGSDWYEQSPSSLVVVATEDDTKVDITPSTITYGLHPADAVFTVTLNAGQVYQIQAGEDLTGTIIHAQDARRIAVFSGARQAAVDCTADSHLMDQNYPVGRWNNAYVVVPFSGQGYDPVRVVASQDGTELRVNCGDPVVLDAGQMFQVNASAPMTLVATAPIGVAQLNTGQDCNPSHIGDPSFQIHPWSGLYRTHARFISVDHDLFDDQTRDFVNVICADTEDSLLLDGVDVTDQLVPLGFGYSTAQLSVEKGVHELEASEGFSGHAYGFSPYDAYTYSLGYDCVGCAEEPPISCK